MKLAHSPVQHSPILALVDLSDIHCTMQHGGYRGQGGSGKSPHPPPDPPRGHHAAVWRSVKIPSNFAKSMLAPCLHADTIQLTADQMLQATIHIHACYDMTMEFHTLRVRLSSDAWMLTSSADPIAPPVLQPLCQQHTSCTEWVSYFAYCENWLQNPDCVLLSIIHLENR